MASPVDTRFVLLSSARSGTSAVMGGIEQHPDTYCHREVFLENYERTVRAEFLDAHDVPKLRKSPVAYADAILDFSPGPLCVGFKMWFSQSRKAAKHVMADPGIKKIILERANRLASYASQRQTKLTGVSHAVNDKSYDKYQSANAKVRFSRQEFVSFVESKEKLFRRYLRLSEGPVHSMKYTDISNEAFAEIFAFLDLPAHPVEMQHRKLNSSDVLGRFAPQDHDLIRETLERLGHSEWVDE